MKFIVKMDAKRMAQMFFQEILELIFFLIKFWLDAIINICLCVYIQNSLKWLKS